MDSVRQAHDDEIDLFGLQKLEQIKKRPDIISRIRFDVTPQMIMEPRFTETGELKKRDLSGCVFYIETAGERPVLMLMRVSKSDTVKTIGIIEELPEEMIRRAIDNPVNPPVHGMYTITKEIEEWIRKTLNLSSA